MNRRTNRSFSEVTYELWRAHGKILCLLTFLFDVASSMSVRSSPSLGVNDFTTHCWNNTNCAGQFTQSFLVQSECCKNGALSYFTGNKDDLKQLLLRGTLKNPNLCQACPTQVTTAAAPKVSCKTKKCPANEKCIFDQSAGMSVCTKLSCSDYCNTKYGKVCGLDDVTYPDECAMCSKSAYLAYLGDCVANPNCRTMKCKPGFICEKKPKKKAQCYPTTLVCGNDNVTYKTRLDLSKKSCIDNNASLRVQHLGPCKQFTGKPVSVAAKNGCGAGDLSKIFPFNIGGTTAG